MQYPKISIITPTYNAEKTITVCLESVAKQNYPNVEHWIIDGLSRDNTLEIIKEYAQKYPHIRYISEKDKGIFDAMNKGIEAATGEYLLFLGADDMLTENILDVITRNIQFLDYDLIYGKVQYPSYTCGAEYKTELLTDEMLLNPFIHLFMHHQGTFIRKQLFQTFGKYDLQYPIGADVHFFIKTINAPQIKKIFFDGIITIVGDEGVSGKKEEIKLRYDFPALAKKYLNITIHRKNYYRNFAKYFFDEIYQKNILKGLKGILKLMINQGDTLYYLKNTIYWLKKRIFHK
jgi:glycosyltransferase involved in cell wall biosynthesis